MLPPNSVLLESTRAGVGGFAGDSPGGLILTRPREVLEVSSYEEVPSLLEALDDRAAAGRWCAGYLAYDAGYGFDGAAFPQPPEPRGPLAWFGVYDAPTALSSDEIQSGLPVDAYTLQDPVFSLDRAAYAERVAAIRRHIREGDVYQINFTAPWHFSFRGNPLSLYRVLREKQRVAFGGVVRAGQRWILTLSPELFVQREGSRLTTRPMKGTVSRGASTEEDRARANWLRHDEKNRAENLMIVDLLRNDLSRVAEPGTVRVASFFDLERYETLWQMTSTVEAEARVDVGLAEILTALFPCGSVTGAPKQRAMQLIRDLEGDPRGVYCGAVGLVRPGGDFVFNVAIRTIELTGEEGRMDVGSGVVWDSDPQTEYDECLLKARFLFDPPQPDFALVETMRAEDGEIPLLERHLNRLQDAAAYFDFRHEEASVRKALADLGPGSLRVRLLISPLGEITVETAPIADSAHDLRTVTIYPEPMPADDPFLRHKTTHRPFYERALGWARARGADEAILLNEQGEVVEGTFTNIWIRKGDRLLTPPLRSDGLPGVFRAHLLETHPRAAPEVLTPADLANADAVLLSNAVRGLIEVNVKQSNNEG
jgi:para-aminobenzoate synthetase / 4-amino-4-deoxychorismate lyase